AVDKARPVQRVRSGLTESLARSPKEEGLQRAFPSNLNGAAGLEDEPVLQPLVQRLRDIDLVGDAIRLHTARRVHCVSPYVVDEPVRPDDAGDDRPCMDADAKLQR